MTMTTTTDQNLELVGQAYEAMSKADLPWMEAHTSPDVRFLQGGRFPTAGEYLGREAMFSHFFEFMTMVGGNFRIEAKDLLASEERVAAYIDVTIALDGHELTFDEVHLWRIADGLVVEMDAIPVDPYAVDAFFAEHHHPAG
jgi:ketosteroid isomerase-like protein